MLIGDVVRDDVDDRPDPERSSLGDQRLGLGQGPEGGIDGAVVGDVVATVRQRRDVPRGEPDGVDAEGLQIGQPRADAGEVPGPVAVAVGEAAQVDLVDDRAAPPRFAAGGSGRIRSGRVFSVPPPPAVEDRPTGVGRG